MKINQLTYLCNEQIIEVSTKAPSVELSSGDEVTLHDLDGVVFIRSNDQLVELNDAANAQALGNFDHYLWQLTTVKQEKLFLQVIPCMPLRVAFEQTLQLGVDEKICADVARLAGLVDPAIKAVCDWLQATFIVMINQQSALLLATYANDTTYASDIARAELSYLNNQTLICIGSQYHLTLEFASVGRLLIRKIQPAPRNRNYQISSLTATTEFVDATLAVQLQDPLVQQKFAELQRNNGAYIALWNEYNQIGQQQAVAAAKAIGFVRFVKCEFNNHVDGAQWQFYYHQKDTDAVKVMFEALRESPTDSMGNVEIATEIPDWLSNIADSTAATSMHGKEPQKAKLLSYTAQFVVLKLEQRGQPPTKGVIYPSISGTMVQMQRRERARDAITTAANPMPQLRALIENIDFDLPRRADKTLEAMTPTVRKSFKAQATAKQQEALHVALNTPDIALILGPPGTGKTQVISALQHRLAEEHKAGLTADILLTSFQNDAVDNVVARSEAFGLPAVRADDKHRAGLLLEQWNRKQISHLDSELASMNQTDSAYSLMTNARAAIAVLLNSRTAETERHQYCEKLAVIVDDLHQLHGFKVTLDLRRRLIELEQLFAPPSSTSQDNSKLLNKIRGLRTTTKSFADDGPQMLWRCIQALKRQDNVRDKKAIETLNMLADVFEPLSQAQLDSIGLIKEALIDALMVSSRPRIIRGGLSQPVISTLYAIDAVLSDQLATCLAGVPDILAEYRQTIESQPDYVASSVQQYTIAVGASCQRAGSERLAQYKQAIVPSLAELDSQQSISFDTVIVDEAARANPLDLFIPMALARRRIILVGDHFQLPQMLEPAIEEQMLDQSDLNQLTSEALKKSLFQRLYEQLKAREAKDGRPRTVMLDTQFRMHPKIGDFVSRHFYEAEQQPKINSILPAEDFAVDLSGYDKGVAKWVDVPHQAGGEKRRSHSYYRRAEAVKVAEIVKQLLNQTDKLSIGVITFYAPQREEIFEALQQLEICDKDESGWLYKSDYRATLDGSERLRVGSVDAFQGKEFDIVILSTVRSNRHKGEDEVSLNRKFGFIRTPNRLNVAFSRAKRFITAVGDKQMFSGTEAKLAVPSIAGFIRQLCEERANVQP